MTFEQIESMAKKNEASPDNIIDLYAYELLKILYDKFRSGFISKDEAKNEKHKIKSAWEKERKDYDFWKEYQQNIKKSEHFRAQINKSNNLADTIKYCAECIYCLTGDKIKINQDNAVFAIIDKLFNDFKSENDTDKIVAEIERFNDGSEFYQNLIACCVDEIEHRKAVM